MQPRLSAALYFVGLLALLVPAALLAQHHLFDWWQDCDHYEQPKLLAFVLSATFLAAYIAALVRLWFRLGRGMGFASAIALLFGSVSLFAGYALIVTVPAGLFVLAAWESYTIARAGFGRRVWLAFAVGVLCAAGVVVALLLRC